MNPNIVPLPGEIHDIYNFEHDVVIGPCACGAWHHSPEEYLDRLPEWHVHLVNPPCESATCSYCVARRFVIEKQPPKPIPQPERRGRAVFDEGDV